MESRAPEVFGEIFILKFKVKSQAMADARILAAYQTMAGANPPTPITPAKLATRAVTGYPTALRWLKIHRRWLIVVAL